MPIESVTHPSPVRDPHAPTSSESLQDRTERQLKRELEMVDLGVKRYRERLNRLKEKTRESRSQPAQAITREAVPLTAEAIKKFLAEVATGKAGRKHGIAYKHLSDVDTDVAALITVRTGTCRTRRRPRCCGTGWCATGRA